MKSTHVVSGLAASLLTSQPMLAAANAVFAHVIVGNTCSYDNTTWEAEIMTAQDVGIDAFALNIAPPWTGCTSTQMSHAFQAANSLEGTFKLFFSFDYLGGGQPWDAADVIAILKAYGPNGAHFRYGPDDYPLVSTFEGTANIDDWTTIRNEVGGIYFVPDWTSLGTSGFATHLDVVDGAFSWDMWPAGANDVSDTNDKLWSDAIGSAKSFMMGVSPWFFTNLPAYGKAWVWRGDDMWHQRWQQAIAMQPPLVEIITWNDFGESHYIGPIVPDGIPSGTGSDAHAYVDNMPHDHWRDSLPYYISAYKGQLLTPTSDDVTMWYRLSPAAAGSSDGVTGNACASPINGNGQGQSCVDPNSVVQDKVFVNAIVKSLPAVVTVQIGDDDEAVSYDAVEVGMNHFSQDFDGQLGRVTVSVVRDGEVVVSAVGEEIVAVPAGGVTNYNAWVGGSKVL